MAQSPTEGQTTSPNVARCVKTVRAFVRYRDAPSPPHQRTPVIFDIPTVRLHLDTPTVTGCGTGLAGVLGRACHSVASSAPSSCHSVGSSGDNLLANCGFDRFCATRWRRVYRHRATRWRRVHRLRATRWRRVARHRDHGDLGYLYRAAAPLAVIEWRDRYVPRTPLRRSMASRISCRVTTRKTVKSRSAQDLPDGLRYYVT